MMSSKYKKQLTSIFAFVLLTTLCFPLGADEPDFTWILYEQEFTTCFPVQKDTINITGLKNKLYFYFKPEKKVFLYLLLSGPEDTFFPVFPGSFSIFSEDTYAKDEYILPADGDWKKFAGEPGEYLLYLIVSKTRLKNLEESITHYLHNKDKNPENGMKQLNMEIRAEIHNVLREWYFSDNKDLPDSSLGTFRNDDVFTESDTDSEWTNMFDSADISDSAYEVLMDKEGFIVIFTCIYE